MLSKINKVNKDNPIFVSFSLFFVPISLPPPAYFDSPFNNFSKSLKPSAYYERESIYLFNYLFLNFFNYLTNLLFVCLLDD